MVKVSRVLIVILLLVLMVPVFAFGDRQLVYDDANLFDPEEIEKLEQEANSLSNDYNMDIVIVTTNDAKGKSSREYTDDFFDYGGFGRGSDYDGILFLIDMDNREAYISTSGIAIRYLTDARIESVLDEVFDNSLGNGDYYGAALDFLEGTKDYLERGIPQGQYNEPERVKEKNKLTVTDIIISLAGGTIAGAVFYGSTKASYKTPRQGNPYSYKANSIVNLSANTDRLINSFVTTRHIPKPPSSKGGSSTGRSTTHRSSSGRTHGGGGRKF